MTVGCGNPRNAVLGEWVSFKISSVGNGKLLTDFKLLTICYYLCSRTVAYPRVRGRAMGSNSRKEELYEAGSERIQL